MSAKNEVQVEFMDDVTALVVAHKAAEESAALDDDAMARIASWIASGAHPNNQTIIAGYTSQGYAAGSAKVYASAILKWVRAGQVPKGIRHAVTATPANHVPGKGGRPKGGGKGKTPAAPQSQPAPVDDLAVTLQGLIARATKLVGAADVARFQDAITEAIACIKRARS